MADNIKKKRINRQYYFFFFACLASLLGLLVYILATKKIDFPNQWMPARADGKSTVTNNLFFTGISIHLQVNFFLQLFFIFLNPEKMDQVKLKK
jgi:uncharacterized membrane protein (DUF485 family)